MLSNTKHAALEFLGNTGSFGIAKLIYKYRVRILAYHRFGEDYVSREFLEDQIKYLKKHFCPIGLELFIEFLCRRAVLKANSVVLTVDDGYQDFYRLAFPILRKYEFPATVFLTTEFIDKRIWLWHDILNFGIKNTANTDFTLDGRVFDLTNQQGKIKLKSHLDGVCTSVSTTERDELINQVLKELGVRVPEQPTSEYSPLTWNQILEMSRNGISFGSHTCTHPILSKLPTEEALYEIGGSKKRLEEVLQREVLSFCYPNGKEGDFNEKVKLMVKEAGFTCAMSLIYGMNSLGSDPYELRRMALDARSYIHFLHDVSGFGVMRESIHKMKTKVLGGQN